MRDAVYNTVAHLGLWECQHAHNVFLFMLHIPSLSLLLSFICHPYKCWPRKLPHDSQATSHLKTFPFKKGQWDKRALISGRRKQVLLGAWGEVYPDYRPCNEKEEGKRHIHT